MSRVVDHIVVATRLGTDVSSRQRAAVVREEIEQSIAAADHDYPARVLFDFAGVRSISGSFADELFAVLVQQKGNDWFRAHIGFSNLEPFIRQVIIDAIEERVSDNKANHQF